MIERIRSVSKQAAHDCIFVNLKPHQHTKSLLDNLVWAVSKCDRLVVDTSGPNGPDMYGSFALGFAFALTKRKNRKQIIRLEEKGYDHGDGLSMWPAQQYEVWEKADSVYHLISSILPAKGRNGERKR
jgi:hypothetical protein